MSLAASWVWPGRRRQGLDRVPGDCAVGDVMGGETLCMYGVYTLVSGLAWRDMA